MPPSESDPLSVSTGQLVMDDANDDLIKGFKLNPVERAWVIDNFYQEFLTNKANRGARNKPNGKKFAHSTVTDAYIEHHWGSWSQQKKDRYRAKLQVVIYNLFNNTLSQDGAVQKADEASKAPKKPKKISPENEWSRNNPQEVQREMNKYLENTPGSSWNVGSIRHVTCRAFEGLPSDQKQYWQDQAEAERQRQNASLPYQGEALVHYVSDWMKLLNRLALDGERCGNLSLAAFVGWQSIDSNGVAVQNVDIYTSENIAGFKDSPEQIEAHAKFTHWLEGHNGVAIRGSDPAPTAIPNPNFHNRPEMPPLEGKPKLALIRQQNRDFINADWSFYGGVGPTPWTLLGEIYRQGQLHTWIHGWPEDLEFSEPSNQNITDAVRVHELLRGRQNGVAIDKQIRFKRVFGSINPPPAHCVATRISKVQHRGNTVHQLDYDGPVDKPQCERAVAYPPRCWAYFYHQFQQKNLDHWLGLASVSNMPVVVLIPDNVLMFIRGFLGPVDSVLSAKVVKTLEMVNLIEEHGPHTTPQGIWGLADANNPLPVLMPARKLSTPSTLASRVIGEFWVPDSYGMSSYAAQSKGLGAHSTLEYFFMSIDRLKDSSFIHLTSQTVQGGIGGVVNIIIPLVQLLLNAAVSALNIKNLPSPPPSSLDLDGLGHGEFYKIRKYFDAWSELCEQSISILSKTSHERIHSGDNIARSVETLDRDLTSIDAGDDELPRIDTTQPTKATGKGRALPSRHAPEDDMAPMPTTQFDRGSNSGERIPDNEVVPVVLDNALFEHTPQRRSSTDFDQRKHIFGLFAAQPAVPTITADPSDIAKEAEVCLTEAQAAVSRWHVLDTLYNVPYPLAAMQHAQTLSQRADESIRPLVTILLLHRFDLNRCRDLWPRVKSSHQGVLLSLRKLSQICKALEDLVRDEAQLQITVKKFDDILAEVKAQSLMCRAIVEPLKQLEQISTYHANCLKDLWDANIFELDPTEVAELVHGLDAWRNHAEETLCELSHFVAKKWQLLGLHDYAEMPKELNFRFGSPGGALFTAESRKILQQRQLAVTLASNPSRHANPGSPRPITPDPGDSSAQDLAPIMSPSRSRHGIRSSTPRPSPSVSLTVSRRPPSTDSRMHSPQPDVSGELASFEDQDLAAETIDKEISASQVTVGEPGLTMYNMAEVDSGPEVMAVPVNDEQARSEKEPTSGKQNEPRRSTRGRATLAGGKILQLATATSGGMHDAPANVLRRSKQGEAGLRGGGDDEAETTVKTRAKRKSEAAVVRDMEAVDGKVATKRRKGRK
ncbi:hypothetical protein RHS04_07632 [Rhizoctonia solani]|uniref:Uncharacterized protein n=1 Tax=Rhizoctonia solani TaxID=456999 RepID=A0A8H7H2P4_9AGAM|nr:hypothetical protein RHS04_07632 [Rhizoctonia solani]